MTRPPILVELNAPLIVADLELPATLSFGQVLVKVHYSGICGAQINEIEGAKGPDKFLPHLLGHEGSGTVLEVGPGVRTRQERRSRRHALAAERRAAVGDADVSLERHAA